MARVFALTAESMLPRVVSRYKPNRARNLSPVTKAGCELERDRGIKHLRTVQVQGQGAKIVTNLLPIPAC